MAIEQRVAVVPSLAAIGVGTLTAIQSRANGSLSDVLGNGLQAAAISFSVGLILLTAIGVLLPSLRRGMGKLVSALRHQRMPWWQVTGGLFGAFFVLSQSLSVPVVGVAIFAVGLVSGQNAASLVVDLLGLGPHGRQPITPRRVLAATIGIIAVGLAVSGRLGDASFSLPLVALCFLAGIGVAIQQAINGRVSAVSGEPIVASWTNFILGAAVLLIAASVASAVGIADLQPLPMGPWWLYLGGVVGLIFIATASWVVGRVGVLRLGLLATAGQLTGSLAMDWWIGALIDPGLVAGVIVSYLAVLVSAGVLTRR